MRDVLALPDYRRLWLAGSISAFGDNLTTLTLFLLVNHLTGSTAAIATMAIAIALPDVAVGLLAGVYVDRLDRRRVMIGSDLLRGVIVLGFAAVTTAGHVWWLYAIAAVQATIGTFFDPARGALVPRLVPAEGLLAANSLSQTTRILTGVLGTGAAGLLVGAFHDYWPAFAVDALTFFASALLVSRIKQGRGTESAGEAGAANAWDELRAGIRAMLASRPVTAILVASSVTMLGVGAINVLMVPFLVNTLRIRPAWFGVVEGAQTASMILAGALTGLLARHLAPSRIVTGCVIGLGCGVGVFALSRDLWHVLLILFAVGWFITPLQAASSTLMQTTVDNRLLGRVGAALGTVVGVANITSMALAGVIAAAVGVRAVFVGAGGLAVIAGLLAGWLFHTAPSGATPDSGTV